MDKAFQDEVYQRVERMQARLREQRLDGALFIFPIDVYYYSGTLQNASLWLPDRGEPVLWVRKSLVRAMEESVIREVRPFPSSKEFAGLFDASIRRVGMTFDVVPVQQFNYYSKLLSGREFVDVSTLHRELRSVKSPFELDRIRQSARRVCELFAQVPQLLKEGMREVDLAAECEYRLRKAGNEGFIRMRAFNQELFMGLAVSSGAATYGGFDGAVTGRGLSRAAPYGASADVIRANEPVFMDYTGTWEGYIADMSRVFVLGKLAAELQQAFDRSLEIQEALRQALKPGVICEDLYLKAVEMADQAGLGKYFMGMPGEQARFVGHGVGLELDEYPILAKGFRTPLQEGQVVALEPKFVMPGKGAIGIENTFVVTPAGGEKLTDIPDEIVTLQPQ